MRVVLLRTVLHGAGATCKAVVSNRIVRACTREPTYLLVTCEVGDFLEGLVIINNFIRTAGGALGAAVVVLLSASELGVKLPLLVHHWGSGGYG